MINEVFYLTDLFPNFLDHKDADEEDFGDEDDEEVNN